MILRDATLADLDEVAALEADLFGSDAWSREIVREELAGDHRRYLVLVDEGGAIRGYAGLLVVGTDGDIQTIAVAPELRGGGHGRALMLELLAEAARRGARQVFLEVRADNPPARGLYASLGFAEIGVRPRYYQPEGIDAIVMQLQLKEQQ
ncbi:ribosomal protein S18-alanine N-acetyltransferase [Leucobacter aridicollis]|uniref:[Ribosomal protein bS18]-alanine N-acetyltransferase n=1 Tax=Leucobacter aridicollis TaxID=283878 RepID=A0A852R705_9MICO|nr:ribosomal protein S18-alanine N-acetyltransferase [Leucobacter aridicollis]MBL3682770.1 ribosomal-protein-alanine N-acetyltransferase [Leucobacter aridicollis]NYD26209.1 ribosomal-protein-alanine acetyltransferase [Leucobacter aridicollis]